MAREEFVTDHHQVGLVDSLKRLARTGIEILHTRLDLLITEIAEEQARLVELAVMAALASLVFLLAIVFAAFLVVAAFWDTPYRVWAPGLIAVVLVAVGFGLWRALRNKARATGKAFTATLQELASDIEHLR